MSDDTRVCIRCGISIAHRRPYAKYCSNSCKVEHNRDAIRESDRLGKARKRAGWTQEERDAANAATREWRAQNPDRVRKNNRRAYLSDKKRYADYRDKWRQENLDAHRASAVEHAARRRARKRSSDCRVVTRRDLMRLLRSGCCAYCGAEEKLTIDHVVPLVRRGRHAIGNLVAACDSCNKSKGGLLLVEWRRKIALEAELSRRVSDSGLVCAGVDNGEPGAA